VTVAAGREFIRRLQICRERGESLIVESTLSGKSLAVHLTLFREAGYAVKIVFISLPNLADSIARVALRVSKGGHDVPLVDLERRFLRAHRNFWHVYRPLVDDWAIFLNSGKIPQLVAHGKNGAYFVVLEEKWKLISWKFEPCEE